MVALLLVALALWAECFALTYLVRWLSYLALASLALWLTFSLSAHSFSLAVV
jgi:hypothetical protein